MLRPTRLLALGGLVAIGFLYWSPLRTYEHTAAVLRTREQQVSALQSSTNNLKAEISSVQSGAGFAREARQLGFVKPGEELFIVRGIATWRARH